MGISWDDIGRGFAAVATGGMSEVAIAGMNAAEKVSKEIEQTEQLLDSLENDAKKIGGNLGVASDKLVCICDQINQTLYDVDDGWIKDRETGKPGEITQLITSIRDTTDNIDELLEINRLTPRSYSELWPSEQQYIQELNTARNAAVGVLQAVEAELAAAVKNLADTEKTFTSIPIVIYALLEELKARPSVELVRATRVICNYFPFAKKEDQDKLFTVLDQIEPIFPRLDAARQQIVDLDTEIRNILYHDPGPLRSIAHTMEGVVDHFHATEQPKFDDILDSVDKTMDETGEVMEQVKHLFVVRTRKAVLRPLTESEKKQAAQMRKRMEMLGRSLDKQLELESEICDTMDALKPALRYSGSALPGVIK